MAPLACPWLSVPEGKKALGMGMPFWGVSLSMVGLMAGLGFAMPGPVHVSRKRALYWQAWK